MKRTYSGETFDTIRNQKAEGGKVSLRRAQIKLAESGNATMLIWLGKQLLNQRDEVWTFDGDLSRFSEEQLERIRNGANPNSFAVESGGGTGTETTPLTSERVN